MSKTAGRTSSEAFDHCFVALAYGDSPFLAGCLEHLRAQTRPSRIVVSTSTPSPFVRRIAADAGVRLFVNPERRGIGADWNFALRISGARHVTLAHQDDIYYAQFLERTLDLFARRPEGEVAFTGAREIADDGVVRWSKVSRVKDLIRRGTIGRTETVAGLRGRAFLAFGNPLPCSAVTFDIARLHGFRFSERMASNLDWEAWWRLLQERRTFLHCAEPLIGRRYNDLTETARLKKAGRRRLEDVEMFRAIWPPSVGDAIARLYTAGY